MPPDAIVTIPAWLGERDNPPRLRARDGLTNSTIDPVQSTQSGEALHRIVLHTVWSPGMIVWGMSARSKRVAVRRGAGSDLDAEAASAAGADCR